jgi:hypothetical protein
LEKEFFHQNQLSNKILNQIKRQKNSKGSQRGLLTALSTNPNPFTSPQPDYIDLTLSLSQSPEKKSTTRHMANKKVKSNGIILIHR